MIKTPMGVVGAIAPWNFPVGACGAQGGACNGRRLTVILKPAIEDTAVACVGAGRVHGGGGCSAGVFQLVIGTRE